MKLRLTTNLGLDLSTLYSTSSNNASALVVCLRLIGSNDSLASFSSRGATTLATNALTTADASSSSPSPASSICPYDPRSLCHL